MTSLITPETLLEAKPTGQDLLQSLADLLDENADEYNALADAYEVLQDAYDNSQMVIAQQAFKLENLLEHAEKSDQLQAQVDALREGNKVLMTQQAELKGELKKTKTAFDVALDKVKSQALKLKELESELKSIKQHGDPKKLIAANKTLRERNTDLMKQNDLFKLRAIEATQEMERLIKKAPESLIEASFSKDGENIYIHPTPLSMERDGKIMSLIALTWWSNSGIGRVVTWDQEKGVPHFASVGHKTVDAKLRPSQEALDWVCAWFRKNVQTVGNKQTFITKYQIKGSKK